MISKKIFIALVEVWFDQGDKRRKCQLSKILDVSSQYISRSFSSDVGSVSSKHIDKLMEITDHAVIMYPGGYFKILDLKSKEQILKGENND
jgi:hypothetical protein